MGRERVLPGSLARLSSRRTPVVAIGCLAVLFPLWEILFHGAYTPINLLPFTAFGWLLIGAMVAGVLRARRPATFHVLGRAVAQDDTTHLQDNATQLEPD